MSEHFPSTRDFFRKALAQNALECAFGYADDARQIFPETVEEHGGGPRLHLTLNYASGVGEDLFFTRDAEGAIQAVRRFYNGSGNVIRLKELFCRFSGITFGGDPAEDYYYHLENPRMFSRFCMAVDLDRFGICKDSGYDPEAGNRWSDPGTIHKRVGRSPYQPFPAVLLSNLKKVCGLVHGTLSQKIFYHCYEFDRNAEKTVDWSVFSACKAVAYREVRPGETLTDEWYFGTTDRAAELEHLFDGYTARLRQKLPSGYGRTAINRHSMVWGSWNDGARRNIKADELLRTAEYLKKNFPTVEWMQIDDGYAAEACRLNVAHGLGMPYEGDKGVDRTRFPEGMKAFYDKVREIGLRPAIWIGGFCPVETPICKEHPEWFCDYRVRVTNTAPLDVSIPEVREYMTHALDVLISEFGNEGVKHDFWSYDFEESNPLLSRNERSGYEYRRWWLQELRKRLPGDGYLQTGCDIVMGNPFLGEFFTNYRYGTDIGAGRWEYVRASFQWGAACFATHTGDLFVPNSDSVGMLPGLTVPEKLFVLNYCLVTGSWVELAGHLDQFADDPWVAKLRKGGCCPNNGQEIFLPGFDYRSGAGAPEKFCFRGPFFSLLRGTEALPLRTLGLFNLSEAEAPRSVSCAELDLPDGEYLAWNVWDETVTPWKGTFSAPVPAHGSALFSIVPKAGVQILDSDLKITAVVPERETLRVTFAFPGPVTLHWWDGSKVRVFHGESAKAGASVLLSAR